MTAAAKQFEFVLRELAEQSQGGHVASALNELADAVHAGKSGAAQMQTVSDLLGIVAPKPKRK
jgi:hypothetical protein